MYGQINDTKRTKMFISCPFGNSLDLQSVGDLCFFLPTEHMSSEAEIKNLFASILMGRSRNRKQG